MRLVRLSTLVALALAGALGCSGSPPSIPVTPSTAPATPVAVAPVDAAVPPVDAPPVAAVDAPPVAPVDAPPVDAPPAAALPTPIPSPGEGKDFAAEALAFYRIVACGGSLEGELPGGADRGIVDKHCAEMRARYQRFNDKYVTPARTFFAGVRPAALPTTVVYPFGGGDLVSAMVTYPEATEITTISLEHAGDPTRLTALTPAALRAGLTELRAAVRGLLINNDSTSENMRKLERGGIPGQLSFHLIGATALGYEPISLRFFNLDAAGQLHYLSQAEIDALAPVRAKRKKGTWVDTDFSAAFTNMELVLRNTSDPAAPVVVHRHFAANLANNGFRGSPLEQHLLAKGQVAAITKAASYLLWSENFAAIRDYLSANLLWMASDATGIPTRNARRAGLTQTTYGWFAGAFLPDAPPLVNETMVKLWAEQPRRKLAFRYGYPDSQGNVHLMITARPTAPSPKAPR